MTMEDADFMLELKNYPETRRFSISTPHEIKRADHIYWLEKNIQYFQVVDGATERIGCVRLFAKEISIWIDRKYWGLGVATEVIKKVSEPGTYAKIVDGNVASFRAFVKSGFVPVAHSAVDKYYILQK